MIHSIEVTGLRALHDVEVHLAPFQVLVGPNASGKSTLFDALLLVRDILRSGLDASVFGDIRVGIPQRAAHPRDLTWMREGFGFQIIVTLELPQALVERLGGHYRFSRYEVSVSTNGPLAFDSEELWLCANAAVMDPKSGLRTFGRNAARAAFGYRRPAPGQLRKGLPGDRKVVTKVVDSGNDYFRAETSKWNNLFRLGPTKSALANLPEDEDKFPAATWTKRQLMEGVHRLALNAEAMRFPAPVGSARDFLPDGSNLPWVVHALEQQDPARKQAWVEHLATSLDDLTDVQTRERPEDRARYLELTYSTGLTAPSWVLSDGTLRLLALTLLAYAPTTPPLVLIEEPENGIHPKAIETVIQSLSSVYDTQILCATHSPVVLSLLQPGQLLCFARKTDGAVSVLPGDRHPRLQDWRSALHLGDLFAAGVLG